MKTYYLIYEKKMQCHVTMQKRWYHELIPPKGANHAIYANSREEAEAKFKMIDRFVEFGG